MSLVWHMVRKDLRRLRLPLILWLVLVLAHTALLLLAGGRPEDPANPTAFQGLGYFANTWGVIVSAVGFVLAAWLVMEDSLVVTTAFWPTRPISSARLLAAKALGAFLMFSVGPALVLTPVWLGCGFSLRELGWAACHQGAVQGILSAAAFAIAGVTATSGQFLVRTAGAAILVTVFAADVMGNIFPPSRSFSIGLADSRAWLGMGLLGAATLVVIAHQYLTRRTLRTWAIGGIGLGLMLAVRFAWWWDFSALLHSDAGDSKAGRPEARNITVVNVQTGTLSDPGDSRCSFRGEVAGVPALSYVRVNASPGEWVRGNERFALHRRLRVLPGWRGPPEGLARQIAGLPGSGQTPPRWEIAVDEPAEKVDEARADGRKLQIALNLSLMRGQVLGELPMRVGAELQSGASRTRISAIAHTEAGLIVRLEDRAAQRVPLFGFFGDDQGGEPRQAVDVFFLVHRPTGFTDDAVINEIGTVQINSIQVGQRELKFIFTPREIPAWENDTVLIQVRFLPEFTFIRPVTVDPFAPTPGH